MLASWDFITSEFRLCSAAREISCRMASHWVMTVLTPVRLRGTSYSWTWLRRITTHKEVSSSLSSWGCSVNEGHWQAGMSVAGSLGMHQRPASLLGQKIHSWSMSFMPLSRPLCNLVIWQVQLWFICFISEEFTNGWELVVDIFVEVEVVILAPNPGIEGQWCRHKSTVPAPQASDASSLHCISWVEGTGALTEDHLVGRVDWIQLQVVLLWLWDVCDSGP